MVMIFNRMCMGDGMTMGIYCMTMQKIHSFGTACFFGGAEIAVGGTYTHRNTAGTPLPMFRR